MKSCDPSDGDSRIFIQGEELGLSPINVVCERPGAKVGDESGDSFTAFVKFIPRVGETIQLDDGTRCVVQRVIYKPVMVQQVRTLVPNIVAVRGSE